MVVCFFTEKREGRKHGPSLLCPVLLFTPKDSVYEMQLDSRRSLRWSIQV